MVRPPGIEPGSSALFGFGPWKADVLDQARLRPPNRVNAVILLKALPRNFLNSLGEASFLYLTVKKPSYMTEFNFVTALTRFECSRCTSCCSLDVMLSEKEMNQLGKNVDRDWRTTKKVIVNSSATCCLLNGKGCTIYESRPTLCRIYPFLGIPSADFDRLGISIPNEAIQILGDDKKRYAIIYDERCPGIGKGALCDYSVVVSLTMLHMSDCFGNAPEPQDSEAI